MIEPQATAVVGWTSEWVRWGLGGLFTVLIGIGGAILAILREVRQTSNANREDFKRIAAEVFGSGTEDRYSLVKSNAELREIALHKHGDTLQAHEMRISRMELEHQKLLSQVLTMGERLVSALETLILMTRGGMRP